MTVRYALKRTTDVLPVIFFRGNITPDPRGAVSYYIMCPGKCLRNYHMYAIRIHMKCFDKERN